MVSSTHHMRAWSAPMGISRRGVALPPPYRIGRNSEGVCKRAATEAEGNSAVEEFPARWLGPPPGPRREMPRQLVVLPRRQDVAQLLQLGDRQAACLGLLP